MRDGSQKQRSIISWDVDSSTFLAELREKRRRFEVPDWFRRLLIDMPQE